MKTFDIVVRLGSIFEANTFVSKKTGKMTPVRNCFASAISSPAEANPYGFACVGGGRAEESFKGVTFDASVCEALGKLKEGSVVMFLGCYENPRTYIDRDGKTVESIDTVYNQISPIIPTGAIADVLAQIEANGKSRETWRNNARLDEASTASTAVPAAEISIDDIPF